MKEYKLYLKNSEILNLIFLNFKEEEEPKIKEKILINIKELMDKIGNLKEHKEIDTTILYDSIMFNLFKLKNNLRTLNMFTIELNNKLRNEIIEKFEHPRFRYLIKNNPNFMNLIFDETLFNEITNIKEYSSKNIQIINNTIKNIFRNINHVLEKGGNY